MSTKALYVHIPFCDHICGYCDFTRFRYNRAISDSFMLRLIAQINQLPGKLKTIYVGGGTPTSLHADQLEGLLQSLAPLLDEEGEFTFEGNPENLTQDKVELLVKYGVNRMSLGVQTTNDDLLEKIGRHHKFYDVKKGVTLLRECGINNISLDLMYGLPGQSLASFEQSMRDVLALKPQHVSIYSLILEPNSIFGKTGIQPVSIEVETEMYLRCIELMVESGYKHYEISNFALEGYESRHNSAYWHYDDFYALGPGSSLKLNHTRKTWTKSLKKYMDGDAFDEIIHLTKEDEMFEYIMMNMRLKDGFSFENFKARFGTDFLKHYEKAIAKCGDLVIITKTHFKASDIGFIMLDDILLNFF